MGNSQYPGKRRRLGSYPNASVIFSITMALFVVGLFGLLLIHAKTLSNIIKENIEVRVYLEHGTVKAERNLILRQFYYEDWVAEKNGKKQIYFVSKEKAAKKFIKETGENFKKFLGTNPLRDAFLVKIKSDFADKKSLKKIKKELSKIDGIFEVFYVENLIHAINDNIRKIGIILMSFAAILIFTVYFLINNTIRLALYSQRFIIKSMQLVGAKSSFIKAPFLKRAVFQGILSGVIASVLLFSLMQYANTMISELSVLQNYDIIGIFFCFLILTGGLIGYFSSYSALNKYLKMSLEDLY